MYESGENYLETILLLKKQKGEVRSIDIARELGFSKPSISRAMGLLKDEEYITVEDGGLIELTPKGKSRAEAIYERHRILTSFLQQIAGVSEEKAEDDACKMEHIISAETFRGIKKFMKID
ncbi:MAG: metal-dependent transcriptional regulator [Lachnospiraceae bacterium]